jgi:S1-C subfamily serine protease
MKKTAWVLVVVALAVPGVARGDATSEALAAVAKKVDGATALLSVTIKTQVESRRAGGPAICVDAEKGIFMTTALNPGLRSEDVQKAELIVPGKDAKRIKAKLLGIDPATGLGFVQSTEKHTWKQIRFVAKSGLEVGQKVVSAGLMVDVPSAPLYTGTGYVGAKLRLPDHLVYVTGGKLTSVCSPVFTLDGKAVGIVGRQLYMNFQTATRRGAMRLPLRGTSSTAFFVPVEEFVDVLTNIPSGGKARRLSWLGVNTFKPVPAEDAGGQVGVKVMQVIPDQPAAKAGLKEEDVIVAVNGESLEQLGTPKLTMQNFVRDTTRMPTGKTLQLTVLRDGEKRVLPVTLSKMPKTRAEAKRYFDKKIGVGVREKVMLDKYLDDSPTADVDGLVVLGVAKGSAAQAAGIQAGDVITHVVTRDGKVEVTSVDTLMQLVSRELSRTGVVRFAIRRGEGEITRTVRPVGS